MVYCSLFKDISPQMSGSVGVKALNLAELFNRGFPVPRGFVIKSRALTDYLLKNKLVEPINNILENVDVNDYVHLLDSSKKITDYIMAGSVPDTLTNEISATYKDLNVSEDMKGLNDLAKNMINAGRGDVNVAVRSSPITGNKNHSASGLHTSVLNILGTPALMKSVMKCFCSFYSPQAIYYYRKNNIRSPELSIIVQEMIVSEKSGVLSTINPITNNLSEFVIEGSYGLGESISSGEITPDRYILNVQTGEITEAKVNKKASLVIIDQLNGGTKKERVTSDQVHTSVLSTNEIKVIAEIGDKIQSYFNHPQDIEWAISKRRAYILQSVPVSTASSKHEPLPEPPDSSGALCTGTSTCMSTCEGDIKIVNTSYERRNLPENSVLVSSAASLDLLPVSKSVKGIITNNGGMLCNLAKIAREMNIPLIVGASDATMRLADGAGVSLDCRYGHIYEKKEAPEEELMPTEEIMPGFDARQPALPEDDAIIATKIKLNVFDEKDTENTVDASDGVGFMSLGMNAEREHGNGMNSLMNLQPITPALPCENSDTTLKVIDAFYPKSVWLKTKDPNDPGFRNQLSELKTIIDKGYTNIGIMLPGIHHQSYVSKIKQMAESIGLNLSSIEFGISIDTPAACLLSEDFSTTGIKFVSIDYDRLIRNTLGLAPDTKITNHDMHPAVLKIMKNCIRNYHKRRIHTSIHGKSITNQQFVEKLVEFNIDSISVNRSELRMLKYVAARTEKKMLLDIMMHKSYRSQVS